MTGIFSDNWKTAKEMLKIFETITDPSLLVFYQKYSRELFVINCIIT